MLIARSTMSAPVLTTLGRVSYLLVVGLLPLLSAAPCEPGWIHHDHACYWYEAEARSLKMQVGYCDTLGAVLARPKDAGHNAFLGDFIRSQNPAVGQWLGWLSYGQLKTTLYWGTADCGLVSYTNWLPGQPSDSPNKLGAVLSMDPASSYGWTAANSTLLHPGVCVKHENIARVLFLRRRENTRVTCTDPKTNTVSVSSVTSEQECLDLCVRPANGACDCRAANVVTTATDLQCHVMSGLGFDCQEVPDPATVLLSRK